jgi:hypothetical protein
MNSDVTGNHPAPIARHAKTWQFLIILTIAFLGPLTGLALAALGLVLAPAWTGYTGLLYLPLACLGLPLGIVAALAGWLTRWKLLGTLALAGLAALVYLTLIGPWLPGGMTTCERRTAASPGVRYTCVVTSSDDPDYRRTFTLQGWRGWPVMRLVE